MRREVSEKGVWKVGELAGRTGVSVRTLHHYDEIGLLSPSGRTASGHRLYSADDVLRLQQIRSLRALGFRLEEIRRCLEDSDLSAQRVIELHIRGIEEQIQRQNDLLGRLRAVAARLRSAEEVSAVELVNTAMEVIEMSERVERYYTKEQLKYLEQRRREFGEERIRGFEAEWAELIEQVNAEMEAGTDPADGRVRRLAKRWMELIAEFTGGDPGIARSAGNMWQQEENIHGMDTAHMRELGAYVSKSLAASDRAE
ncbi:MAG TPA: MerR family transcriptional regulator [Rubrobacteraceae bacterium]|nr:MerR family transcriptional regulator [Rubrobacteraceae bacterium]